MDHFGKPRMQDINPTISTLDRIPGKPEIQDIKPTISTLTRIPGKPEIQDINQTYGIECIGIHDQIDAKRRFNRLRIKARNVNEIETFLNLNTKWRTFIFCLLIHFPLKKRLYDGHLFMCTLFI